MTQAPIQDQMTKVATARGAKAHWSAPESRYFATRTACGRPAVTVALTAHLQAGMCAACATVMVRIVEEAHAEAIMVNEKLTQIGRLERHPSPEARATSYEIRDELLAAGFAAQAVGDVPAELCDHGIKRGRKCSICREDAVQTPKVSETWTTIPRTVKVISVTDTAVYFQQLWDGDVSMNSLAEFRRRFELQP